MKLPRPLANSRAQLADKLLAYSVATAATVGAVSTAKATIYDLSDPGYFGGSLPSISLAITTGMDYQYLGFSVGNAQFNFNGSRGVPTSTLSGTLNFVRDAGITQSKLNGNTLPYNVPFQFKSVEGVMVNNDFGGYNANFTFATHSGGNGILNLQVGYDGLGNISLGVTDGSFDDGIPAIPEPANLASGLGLIALGYVGIREHRRRRTVAKATTKK